MNCPKSLFLSSFHASRFRCCNLLIAINRKSSSFTPTFPFVCFSPTFLFTPQSSLRLQNTLAYGKSFRHRKHSLFRRRLSFLFRGSRLRLNERHKSTFHLGLLFPFRFRLRNEKCDVRELLCREFLQNVFCTHDACVLLAGNDRNCCQRYFIHHATGSLESRLQTRLLAR